MVRANTKDTLSVVIGLVRSTLITLYRRSQDMAHIYGHVTEVN